MLARTGAMTEAETLLLEAYDLSSSRRGASASRTVIICERIVALYEAWNETEPDLDYQAKAAEWRAKLEPIRKSG